MAVDEASLVSDRFNILRRLGEGGMGVVYEAFDARLQMKVALKTLRAASADLLYQFKNEFRSLAGLHHPNLITLYELFSEKGSWYFTMELVGGEDFDRFVCTPPGARADEQSLAFAKTPLAVTAVPFHAANRTILGWGAPAGDSGADAPAAWNGRYDDSRLRHCLGQLATGLSALHRSGKVHRDIKPSNVLVTPEGRVVLMDFGLTADAELMEEWAAMRNIAGTPAYMAPEQAQPGAVGTAADWYSVGAMLYEILAGRPPHEGGSLEVLFAMKTEPPPPLSSLALPTPPPDDLARLCEGLLAPDPADRPSGPEVLTALGIDDSTPAGADAELFIGRERELEALRAAYRDAERGPVTAFVQGPSGLGKTALVDHFLAELRAGGALVLRGRCHAEESVPYKGMDGIVDALSRALITMGRSACADALSHETPDAARIFPVLLRIPGMAPPARADDVSAVELRSRAFSALGAVFRAIAGSRRLVLFIDDLQWADADSLLLLRELLRREAAPPMLFIAAIRPEGTGGDELAAATGLSPRMVPIGALGSADTRELLSRLAPALSAARRDEIEREAGGHPLFIAELARSDCASGARLDDALYARAHRLPDPAPRVLEVVAVAGAPIDIATLADAAGLDSGPCAGVAARLRSERLLKQAPTPDGAIALEPYHDRVRETITERLSEDEFARISRGLSNALLAAGVGDSAPELVVRHLLAAGDARNAATLAESAAERARAALAFDRAAAFLRSALTAVTGDPTREKRLGLQLAEALASAGRGGESAEAFLAAGAGAGGDAELDCRRRAAEQLLASGHVDRGLSELKSVMATLGEPVPEEPADALASLRAAREELDRWLFPSSYCAAEDVDPALLRRLDTFQATSLGLILVDNVRGADFQARALRLALQAREPRRLHRALLLEAIYHAQESEDGRRYARGLLDAGRALAAGREDPWMDGYIVFVHAWITYYEGQFRHSVELFTAADEMFRELPGVSWERNTILLHRLRATDYQGAWAELRPLYEEYLRDAQRRDDRYVQASLKRWFNVLWLARDRPDLAGEDLDASPWTPPQEGRYHLQHFLELRARVELALYRGEGASQGAWAYPGLDAAERSLLFRIQIAKVIGDWLRGRIAICEGDADYADAMVARLADENIVYASIWGGLLAGGARAVRGRRAEAIEVLTATAELAGRSDFPLCAEFARLRAAELRGDEPAAERALSWMHGQDIHNPRAMAEVFAPIRATERSP